MIQYTLAATPGVYYAFQNSDTVGKVIVLGLLAGSVLTWSLMIDKYLHLRRARSQSERFLAHFNMVGKNITSSGLIREGMNNSGPLAVIYNSGVDKLVEFYEAGGSGAAPCKLSDAQGHAIEAVLERKVSGQIQDLETNVSMLATLVSLSPFCGLFGTVWGVMMAFSGIAIAGKPDFTALAPGVAGALLTTVAGLIVAIPSLVGYNFITGEIRKQTTDMDNFTDEFMVRVQLGQLALEEQEN